MRTAVSAYTIYYDKLKKVICDTCEKRPATMLVQTNNTKCVKIKLLKWY